MSDFNINPSTKIKGLAVIKFPEPITLEDGDSFKMTCTVTSEGTEITDVKAELLSDEEREMEYRNQLVKDYIATLNTPENMRYQNQLEKYLVANGPFRLHGRYTILLGNLGEPVIKIVT